MRNRGRHCDKENRERKRKRMSWSSSHTRLTSVGERPVMQVIEKKNSQTTEPERSAGKIEIERKL